MHEQAIIILLTYSKNNTTRQKKIFEPRNI